MKKLMLITVLSVLFISVTTYADNAVSCKSYLIATKFAFVINKQNHQTFFIKRHLHQNISNEKYIFPNGKVIIAQSHIVNDQADCAAYVKNAGHFVQTHIYTILKMSVGYFVKATFENNVKQKFRVYPLTVPQIKKIIQ